MQNLLKPLAVSALLLSASLTTAAEPAEPLNPADGPQPVVVFEINAFGIDLYQRVAAASPEANVFLSPVNIASALRMTAEGAKGETLEGMRTALHMVDPDAPDSYIEMPFHEFLNALQPTPKGEKESPLTLTMAQALWLQKDYPFEKSYVAKVQRDYLANATPLDFGKAAEATATINEWVEKRTNERIKELIPDGAVDGNTKLVLTTAIYFLGTWAEPFEKGVTKEEPFTLASGEAVDVPIMRDEKRAGYLDGEGFKLLALPYKGGDVSMVILLPDDADGLAALEAGLTADRLDGWLGEARSQKVNVYLPRFEMTVPTTLNDPLKAMGMTLAFDPREADLTGISTAEPRLYISDVLHKAFVKVDERGTEAAAATAVIVAAGSAQMEEPPTFRADHPFLFAIRHEGTGTLLFLGRVMDPR